MGGGDAQMVETRRDVVGGARLRVGGRALRHVRGRIPPRVEGDAAVALAEMPQLRLPAAGIAGEFMDEDHRNPCPRLLVMEANSVIRSGLRHAFLRLLRYRRPAMASSGAPQPSPLPDFTPACCTPPSPT